MEQFANTRPSGESNCKELLLAAYRNRPVRPRMLIAWNRVRASRLITAWLILFAVMLADDATGLHEAIGGGLMRIGAFTSLEGVCVKDIAEVIAFAMLEGTACVYVVLRYSQAPRGLAFAMLPLVLVGLLLDILPFHELEQPVETASMSILLGFVHG